MPALRTKPISDNCPLVPPLGSSRLASRSRRQSLQHLIRPPKPRPLPPPQVPGHSRLLIEHLLRPLAGFGVAALGGQQIREIQVSLRQGRRDRFLPEERLGLFLLSGLRIGVSEQSGGALEIVVGLFADDALKVR